MINSIREEGTYTNPVKDIHFFVERKIKGKWKLVIPPSHLVKKCEWHEFHLLSNGVQLRINAEWAVPFDLDLIGMLAPECYDGFKRKYPAITKYPRKPFTSSPAVKHAIYPALSLNALRFRSSIYLSKLISSEETLRKCSEYFVDVIMKEMRESIPRDSARSVRAVFWFDG
jgi:hypothetical protein